MQRFFLIADAAGDATTGGFSALLKRQNQGEAVTTVETVTGNTVYGGLIELWPDNAMEQFDMTLSKSAAQSASFRLHFIAFDAVDYGEDIN